jgi:hypothetical protein
MSKVGLGIAARPIPKLSLQDQNQSKTHSAKVLQSYNIFCD